MGKDCFVLLEDACPAYLRFLDDGCFVKEAPWTPQLNIAVDCGDAPCVKACPTGALYKRDDGIVLVDQSKCIGCHECLWSCPFGIPQFGENGLMQKCTMCYNRIDEGGQPACAANCPAEAIICDTVENVSKILRERYSGTANTMSGFAGMIK